MFRRSVRCIVYKQNSMRLSETVKFEHKHHASTHTHKERNRLLLNWSTYILFPRRKTKTESRLQAMKHFMIVLISSAHTVHSTQTHKSLKIKSISFVFDYIQHNWTWNDVNDLETGAENCSNFFRFKFCCVASRICSLW